MPVSVESEQLLKQAYINCVYMNARPTHVTLGQLPHLLQSNDKSVRFHDLSHQFGVSTLPKLLYVVNSGAYSVQVQ